MTNPLSKNEIITALFIGDNFNQCLSKMEPAHLREDLKQEVALIVCQWPEERIVRYHTAKALEFYVVRVILNQIQSSTSPFYKKYRRGHSPFDNYSFGRDTYGDQYTRADIRKVSKNDVMVNNPEQEGEDEASRRTREDLEDFTIGQIDNLQCLSWYESEMVKLYMIEGSYRAMEAKTLIPYPTCFKAVRKAIEKLRKQVEIKKAEPVFTKAEQKFIQDGDKENI